MRRRIIKICMIILSVVLIGSLILGIIYFTSLNKYFDKGSFLSNGQSPKYHFMVVVDGSNPSYLNEYKKGMMEASSEYNVAFEFWSINSTNRLHDIVKQVDLGIQSNVDGIIVEAYKNEEFIEVINKAMEKGIPVVTINEDVPESSRISHVGISKFSIGLEIGRLLNNEIIGTGDVVVLQRNTENNQYNNLDKGDGLIVLGIKDTIKDYADIKVEEVNYSGESVLSAEEVTMKVLEKNKNVKAIICTNGQDTLGVVQVLIDFNKLSNITVIGYGDLPEILDYIDTESKVVYATVIADYKKVGYNSIETLVKYKEEDFVSTYTDVDITVITKDNIDEYRLSEENEEN